MACGSPGRRGSAVRVGAHKVGHDANHASPQRRGKANDWVAGTGRQGPQVLDCNEGRIVTTRRASCSCGQLSAEVAGKPTRISVCHCLACQRRTGSVFGAQARFSRSNVRISGRGTDFVRVGDDGTQVTFTFCPDCGATVYYVGAGNEDEIAIPVGAFADPTFPGPNFSVYEERMHAWVRMPPDIEHAD